MSTTSQSLQPSVPVNVTPPSVPAAPTRPSAKKVVTRSLATTPPALKPAAKSVPKPTPKPAPKRAVPVAPAVKPEKPKKPKLVRDSFTIPKAEYVVLEELKLRANRLMNPAKKSELLRAGIKALAAMTDSALLAALKQVPAIKTGRPKAKV